MRKRWLIVVPILIGLGAAIMQLGPYAKIGALLGDVAPLEEAPATVERVSAVRAQMGDQIGLYRAHLLVDVVFAASNAGALAVLIGVGAGGLGWIRARAWLAAPALLLLCELAENGALLVVLASEQPPGPWVAMSGAATISKFVMFGLCVLLTAVLWACVALRGLRRVVWVRAQGEPAGSMAAMR
jgi:hypothetical protein